MCHTVLHFVQSINACFFLNLILLSVIAAIWHRVHRQPNRHARAHDTTHIVSDCLGDQQSIDNFFVSMFKMETVIAFLSIGKSIFSEAERTASFFKERHQLIRSAPNGIY